VRDEVERVGLPDLLCLQEVDRFDDVARELAELGYKGAFLRRTGSRDDGCATFWRHGGGGVGSSGGGGSGGVDSPTAAAAAAPLPASRLAPVRVRPVRFEDHGLKDNVALLVEFEVQCGPATTEGGAGAAAAAGAATTTRRLIVANTHLMFTKDRGDIKVGQTRVLLEAAAAMAAGGEPPAPAPAAGALTTGSPPPPPPPGGVSRRLASAAAAALRAASLTFGAGFRAPTGPGSTPPPPLVMSPADDAAAELLLLEQQAAAGSGGGLPAPSGPTPAATAQPLRPRELIDPSPPSSSSSSPPAAVLVACDLNAVPGSALYALMTEGELDLGGKVARRSVSGQNEARGVGGFAARRAAGGTVGRAASAASPTAAKAEGSAAELLNGAGGGGDDAGSSSSSGGGAAVSSSATSSSGGSGLPSPSSSSAAPPQPWTDREILRASGLPPQELMRRQQQQQQQKQQKQVAANGNGSGSGSGSIGSGGGGEGALTLRHPFAGVLRSTYADVDGREPPFTSSHLEFMDACDYIFYTPGGAAAAVGGADEDDDAAATAPASWRLQPVSVLRAPAGEALPLGLPAEGYGSDHVALVADYVLEAL
jgi:hypothetical protein